MNNEALSLQARLSLVKLHFSSSLVTDELGLFTHEIIKSGF